MISEVVIKRYMDADCHILALALNVIGNHTIHVLTANEEGSTFLVHAFVAYGDRFLDIKGLRSLDEIKKDFSRYKEENVKHRIILPFELKKDYYISDSIVEKTLPVAYHLLSSLTR